MENNQWYDSQDFTTGYNLFSSSLVGSVVRTGQFELIKE